MAASSGISRPLPSLDCQIINQNIKPARQHHLHKEDINPWPLHDTSSHHDVGTYDSQHSSSPYSQILGTPLQMSACKTHHSNPLQQHAANMATGYHIDTISTFKCHDIMVAASPDHLVIGPSSVLPSWHHIITLQGQAITS